MGLVVICGLILRLYRDEFAAVAGSVRFRIATFIQVTGQRAAVLLGAGFVVLAALLLSQSRGGILSTGLGLFALAILSAKDAKSRGLPSSARPLLSSAPFWRPLRFSHLATFLPAGLRSRVSTTKAVSQSIRLR